MKKFLLAVLLVLAGITQAKAQNDTVFYVTDIVNYSQSYVIVCSNKYDRALIYAEPNCNGFKWFVNGEEHYENPLIITPTENVYIEYFGGCNIEELWFALGYSSTNVPASSTRNMWKHQDEPILIEAIGSDSIYMYTYYWPHSNETTATVEVSNSGSYQCYISDQCGTAIRTFNVKDNVEIMSASVDPVTNKNLVTWEVTPEQAEYISNVIINRDGVDMATVPYTDGQYLDNIGSDLAARVYTITGVCPDGTLCPIPSYQRGTIHMAFLPDINGNVEMTWNQPILDGAPIHVNRFEICEYDPDSNEINVIDFVSSVTTSYSCNQSMFDYGYPLIRAVIHDGRGDKDMLSNRTDELVGLNEMATDRLHVYPNPSSGVFTINGSGILHIINVVGQEIMAKEIDGKETVTLPKGVYFVQLNGTVQKIVVE